MYDFYGNIASDIYDFYGDKTILIDQLYAKDKKIYSMLTGEQVEIRGIGTHFPVQYSNLHTYNAIKSLKLHGVNTIRISVYLEDYIATASDGLIANGYLLHKAENDAEIEKIIDNCFQLGMNVLLDWHVYTYQNSGNVVNSPVYSGFDCIHEDDAYEFFEKYSSKYGNKLMYEFANEPHSISSAQFVQYLKNCRSIVLKYTNNPVMVSGHGTDGTDGLWNNLKAIGIQDIFVSHHLYGGGDPIATYKEQYNKGMWVFNSEWGNSSSSGDGEGNDNNAVALLDFYHETKIPHCFWKYTDQTMTTSVLKNRGEINSEYYANGFSDSDLSHNGKLFFDKFKEYQ